jgi:Xaa-Pro aminopeptidase
MGFTGAVVPEKYDKIFQIIRGARDAGVALIEERLGNHEPVCGWEVDRCVRNFINESGYGEYFTHRTGHAIDQNDHGIGANLDDFESHDERRLFDYSLFSIEPGLYLPEFGMRTEINAFLEDDRLVISTLPLQMSIMTVC